MFGVAVFCNKAQGFIEPLFFFLLEEDTIITEMKMITFSE